MALTACLDDRATGVSIGWSQRSHNEMRWERLEDAVERGLGRTRGNGREVRRQWTCNLLKRIGCEERDPDTK